jgi:glycosyltransferase involved in cell wall biosynthesis
MAGLPVISHVRNRTSAIPHRYKTVLNLVNRFVFVSKDTWRQFGYRVPHSRGSVLYDGFDMPDFGTEPVEDLRSQLGVSASAKLIGMAARVNPQKDYRTLIEAAVHVVKSEPEARFLVIGDYERLAEHREHYTKVQEWLRTSGMEPYFIFAGYRTQVPRLLRALDIFVLSTNYEGLPLVILEAMACAKPVVATAVDGVPEVVRHRETGLLHAPGDSVALANDLLELLHNPDRAAALGVAGRRLVEAEFSGRRFAEDVHRLYRDMLHLPQG